MSNGLILTHCGLVTPHCDIAAVGQHWLGNGLPPDGTKPLLAPMMIYCQLDTLLKKKLYCPFNQIHLHLKMLSAKRGPFCSGLNVLNST